MINVQKLPSSSLLDAYRETLLALGADRSNVELSRQSDQYAEEIMRRMAW